MKQAQKIIKYLAIAFGIFLSINIIYWLVFGTTSLLSSLSGVDVGIETGKGTVTFSEVFVNVKNLDIEISTSKLIIKEGNELKVEGRNLSEDFYAKLENETLVIKDKNKSGLHFNEDTEPELVIYLPHELSKVKIDTGVGQTHIKGMKAQSTKINCGAGKVEIKDAILNDADLTTGVGTFEFEGKLTGNSKVDCGVGKIEIDLIGSKDDYRITTETGLGTMELDGERVDDNQTYGNGNNNIKVTGGVGKTEISFTAK